ncbi:methyltransferase [Curtobacterium sp. MCBD17_034]|uniref:DUF7059 domain-containing protein n=1 Tax=unclassified Curtobacterium TaxID=257496 RepID=UPI0035CB23AC
MTTQHAPELAPAPARRIVPDAELARALAEDLRTAGYTVDAVDALWGTDAAAALHRGDRVPALRALDAQRRAGMTTGATNDSADDRAPTATAPTATAPIATAPTATAPTPTATLATCFVLGVAVPRTDADAALPTAGVEALAAAGLLRLVGDHVVPAVDLRPYAFVDDAGAGSWWILSDLGEAVLGGPLGEDHVLGVGGATMTLSGLMVPVPVRRVLDLGTGCGIQAMHARRHADQVVATDISERALAIARFNADLNGLDGIEFRLGSLFEPVAGERFDRIVSNPPFVITPRRDDVPSYEYRDGGMVGDGLVETVLRGLAEHLEPGGTAQLLGNWEYRWGRDGLDRVRGWFDDTASARDVDVWVVEREQQDPARYAETWIRDGGTRPGTPAHDRLVDAWLDDFAARHVTAVGFGYVVVRRPDPVAEASGAPSGGRASRLRRFERIADALGSNPTGLGAAVARTLDAVAWSRGHDDEALGRAHLVVAGDVTEERHYWPGNDDPTVITLVQGGGFARRVDADTALAAFVGACDGDLSVRAIIEAIADLTGVGAEDLAADLLPRVRALLQDGLLRPPA